MTNAFLLTRQWRDTRDGLLLDYWWATPEGPVCTQITAQPVVMFIAQERKQEAATRLAKIPDWHMSEVDLRTYRNQPVVAVYFRQHRHMRDARDLLNAANITCWETDIKPTERYLMERFITATAVIDSEQLPAAGVVVNPRLRPLTQPWRPALNMMSIDIETSMDAKTLFSIAYWCNNQRRVFVVGEGESQSVADGSDIVFCSTAETVFRAFFS
jgi:DNA polymerase-2